MRMSHFPFILAITDLLHLQARTAIYNWRSGIREKAQKGVTFWFLDNNLDTIQDRARCAEQAIEVIKDDEGVNVDRRFLWGSFKLDSEARFLPSLSVPLDKLVLGTEQAIPFISYHVRVGVVSNRRTEDVVDRIINEHSGWPSKRCLTADRNGCAYL